MIPVLLGGARESADHLRPGRLGLLEGLRELLRLRDSSVEVWLLREFRGILVGGVKAS